jgi:hypothetical protein
MSPITEAPNGILRWTPRPGRTFVLIAESGAGTAAEDHETGRLYFSGKSGSLARGETAHGEWTFKREGFLYPRITVRTTGTDGNCGALMLSANGNGKLNLTSGEEFNFVTGGWLQSHWSFNRGLVEIMRFSRDGSSADVEILNPKMAAETLSLLVLLGWYAPLLAAEEAAVIASTVVLAIT